MSRLGSLSPAALRAVFSPDSDDTLIVLLTFTGTGVATPIRIADNFTQRLSETDDDVVYGVRSRGNDFIFLPFNFNLPTEDDAAPRCKITINDVTRHLIPAIRMITQAPTVTIELVLASDPDVVEVSVGNFLMSAISYNADTITGELTVDVLANEPFPAHTFTPSYFPGMF